MAGFFDGSIRQIVASIDQPASGLCPSVSGRSPFSTMFHSYKFYLQYILLVGGFGESSYLRDQIRQKFSTSGCEVVIVNDSTYVHGNQSAATSLVTCILGIDPIARKQSQMELLSGQLGKA